MDLSYGAAAEAFRREVRAFLEQHWAAADQRRRVPQFRAAATEAGYLYRSIPTRFGGSEQDADVLAAQVIREEFARARAPMEVGGNGMNMLVPTLLEHGTEAQRERFIPPTIAGTFKWGQGYSEPGTGSDLASVHLKGELVGGQWVLNGQKTWTSQGAEATHMFALVRTEPHLPKHEGISYLLIDLDQTGVTRKPIRQMTGEQGFYEFFFDNAVTPADWLVGKRGGGWQVSRTTLKHERASIASADRLGGQFAKLVDLARTSDRGGLPAIRSPQVRDTLARIEGRVLAHRYSSLRLLSQAAAQDDAGRLGLMMKLMMTEIGHDIARLAQDLIADAGLIEPAPPETRGRGPEKWLDQIMGALGNAIAGGTTNIQRTIIAERGLGLPRDLAMEQDR